MNLIIISISTCLVSLLIISILIYLKLLDIQKYLYMTKELREIDTQESPESPESIIGNEFKSSDKESVFENKTEEYKEELQKLNDFKFLTRTPKVEINSLDNGNNPENEKKLIKIMMEGLDNSCLK